MVLPLCSLLGAPGAIPGVQPVKSKHPACCTCGRPSAAVKLRGRTSLWGDDAGRSLEGAGCRAQARGGGTGCLTLAKLGPVLKQPADPGGCHCLEFMWVSGVPRPRFQLSELLSLGQLRIRVGDRLYCFRTLTGIDMARWL